MCFYCFSVSLGGGDNCKRDFMSKFHVKLSARAKGVENNVAMFDALYADREKLETIFRFFDTDGNGTISREEFHKVIFFLGGGNQLSIKCSM